MLRRNCEYHFILPDFFKRKSNIRILETNEPDLDLAVEHLINDPSRIADSKYRLYPEVLSHECAELLRQEIFAGNVASANPKLAAERAVKLLNLGHRFPFKGQKVSRLLDQQ